MSTNHRILGMGDFSRYSTVSEELLALLWNLSEHYETLDYLASSNFRSAYNVLLDCVNGESKEYVSEREVNNGITYRIVSPVLEAIFSKEKLLFGYDSEYGRLYNIKKETLSGNAVPAYGFSYSGNKLDAVMSLDKDSIPVGRLSMTYYTSPDGEDTMSDVFGFQKPYSSDPYAPFNLEQDGTFARIHSLKEIHSADGGKICLDYELNGLPFGGIRIKSVVLDNPSEGRSDTISYLYESAQTTFLEYPVNYEMDEYSGFTDCVLYSRIKSKGHATLSPGNNGIYYPIVHENIAGQGTRILYSNFTDYSPELSHSHWLVGLPAFIVEQDEDGNVERVLQNLYYTDLENGVAPCLFPESLIHLDAVSYSKVLTQMVANEKYMDLEDVKREMNISSEEDMSDPHERTFWMNIAPRIRSSYENILYQQYYGGATVLAEQREYRSQGEEYTDFRELMSEQMPCSRTVYHYDNLQEHTRPTRIVSYDSQGDSTVVHQVYAGDMSATSSEAIAAMQEANILAPVVKRAIVKGGALVEEEVTVYETVAKEDGCFYASEKVVVRSAGNGSYTPDTLSQYVGSMADYQERTKIESAVVGEDSYLPAGIIGQGIHTALLYNPNNKLCILEATDVSANKLVAIDCLHYGLNNPMYDTDEMERILYLAEKFQTGIEGYNPESIELDDYKEFLATSFYNDGKSFLELLGKEPDISELAVFFENSSMETYTGINDYIIWQISLTLNYFPTVGVDSPWDMSVEEMTEFESLLMSELYMNNGSFLLDYLQTYGGTFRYEFSFVPQTLVTLSGQQGYKLYLIPMEEQALVTYTITHSGGTVERVLELSGLMQSGLQEISIDLSGYDNVSGMTVTGFNGLQYLALVPEGIEFEAVSFNEDGTVAFKFDRSGQMRHHEYDSAGRLIRVRDENGKTLEESDCHKKNTTH